MTMFLGHDIFRGHPGKIQFTCVLFLNMTARCWVTKLSPIFYAMRLHETRHHGSQIL